MSCSAPKGRKRVQFHPYTTYVGTRNYGNTPARYLIKRPETSTTIQQDPIEIIEPPPVLKHFTEEEYEQEPTTSAGLVHVIENEYYGTDMIVDHEEIIFEEYGEHDLPQKIQGSQNPNGKRKQKDLRYTYPRCYVEPSRRWTYKDQQQPTEDGLLYYVPNPFLPVPPTKGAPSAVVRMHYAASRVDSIKFRGQHNKVQEAKERDMESANCEKCHMRYFLPFCHMRSRISYSETDNRYDLPMAHFKCPLCKHRNQIVEYNKEDY